MEPVDFLIVGGGMAGAGIACELAVSATVFIAEREVFPGYHATGRSAAVFSETYGNETIRAITRCSRAFLENPPPGFSNLPLLGSRSRLYIARADQLEALERQREISPSSQYLNGWEASLAVPALRDGYVAAALYDDATLDMDVHALHQGFLRLAKARGAKVVTNAEVLHLDRQVDHWRVETRAAILSARTIVNAAGAWADQVGGLAGASKIGLRPLRRTALLIDPPAAMAVDRWPLVTDIDEMFYFKPDAGRILLSPADETDSPACDAQPDELDVAVAVDRFERATTVPVRRVQKSWAGLRSFVADRTPVVGFDREAPGFFWLAGQGGYGIQTAPAMARLAAALALGRDTPGDIAETGVTSKTLSPDRATLFSIETGEDIQS